MILFESPSPSTLQFSSNFSSNIVMLFMSEPVEVPFVPVFAKLASFINNHKCDLLFRRTRLFFLRIYSGCVLKQLAVAPVRELAQPEKWEQLHQEHHLRREQQIRQSTGWRWVSKLCYTLWHFVTLCDTLWHFVTLCDTLWQFFGICFFTLYNILFLLCWILNPKLFGTMLQQFLNAMLNHESY